MPKETKYYLDVLKSDACQCEKYKRYKMAFCYRCFKSLPGHMQRALYRPLGDGFEEAYEESSEWLRDKENRG